METIKACIDRIIDPNQALGTRLAGWRGKLWPEDQRRLHIRFLGGSPALQKCIIEAALEWEEYAGIEFVFDNHPRAQIRIAFDTDGSWSYVGTDALQIPEAEPTVNFGWLTDKTDDAEVRRVVLHEFGHTLGMIHEHQSPNVAIPWDKAAVYRYYQGPPNFWNREQIDTNIFLRYAQQEMDATVFDPQSIMLYPVPNQLTIGNFETPWNDGLSEFDKSKIAEIYPRIRVR